MAAWYIRQYAIEREFDRIGCRIKYSIVDDKAYTEDGILIKELFFSVENKQYEELVKVFQKFGKIINFKLYGNGNLGSVEFDEYEAAANILQKHDVGRRGYAFFRVQPSFSWRQPDGKKMILFMKNISTIDHAAESNSSYYQNNASILNLNEDCVRYIYSYLPLKDQLNLAITCKRFLDIFRMKAIHKYKYLQTTDLEPLTLWHQLMFLKIVGEFVERLHLENPNLITSTFIRLCCSNVKTFYLADADYLPIFNLVYNMKMLLNFELEDSSYENCSISRAHSGTSFITEIHGLEELGIDCHWFSKQMRLSYIFTDLQSLRYLNIRLNRALTERECEDISKNLINLESLHLKAIFRDLSSLAKLPQLKILSLTHIDNSFPSQKKFFENLVEHRSEQLEELILYGRQWINLEIASLISALKTLKILICPNNIHLNDLCLDEFKKIKTLEALDIKSCSVTNNGILHLVENCPNLRLLYAHNISTVTSTLLKDIKPILKKQHDLLERCKSLEIIMDKPINLCSDLLPELQEPNAKNILKVTYL